MTEMIQDRKPVVLLETSRGSTWGSCLTIMPNLADAYRQSEGERVVTLDYGKHSSPGDILRCAQKIADLEPSHIVFLDHQKHPYDLFIALSFVLGRKRWPTLVFHLYGDFTLYTHLWAKCERLLRARDVRFVCASPRQRNLVSYFLRNSKSIVSTCPFPVSAQEFHYVESLRDRERAARSIADDEFVMLYTGRLSLQKNILKMIWDLSHAAGKLGKPWRLFLAGTFDDLGEPFFGLNLAPDSYARGYETVVNSLSHDLRERVHYIGALGKPELLRAYHAADLFVSFSTHHDEDYGMSPIEALCCGTRALITNWGGFGGFAIDTKSVSLVPVKIFGRGTKIESSDISLDNFATGEASEDRAKRSQLYLSRFDIEAAAKIVNALLRTPEARFSSFTPFLKTHAQLIRQTRQGRAMFFYGRNADPNYARTYRNYLAESKGQK